MRPMSDPLKRAAAIATLALSAVAIAVLALRGLGFPVAIGPLASPSPIFASQLPAASAGASVDPAAAFAAIEPGVRQLRGLPDPGIGPPRVVGRAELPGLLTEIFDRDWSPDALAGENLMLRALGLFSADQEIRALTQRLYEQQALGFYDPLLRRMVVVTDAGATTEARIGYAHEYTHALQDAAFHLDALRSAAAGNDDRSFALVALEEGDASTAMVLWAIGHLAPAELSGLTDAPIPQTAGIPAWMVRQLQLPYLAGAQFVGRLYAAGGWDAVNAAYADPPISMEQVLHARAYLDNLAPDAVAALTPAATLGSGWSEVEQTTLGEGWVSVWLEGIGVPRATADIAAAGWGGDRISVAGGPGGAWALAWSLSWDAPVEAREFADAYATASAALPFATRLVQVDERHLVVLQASAAGILATMAAGL